MKSIEDYIISVPDFPKPGILFRDVTGILGNAEGLKQTLAELYKVLGNYEFDAVAGLEARGFLFGVSVAEHFGKPFIPVRKKGKLPRETVSVEYELEYGTATLEIHKDAIQPGQKVLLVDDLIATGGTNLAMAHLIESLGGEIAGVVVLMELAGLKGREKLGKYPLYSALTYAGK